jgi:metal-responsive CopG/Arc/MetJ family transcriptional regulator
MLLPMGRRQVIVQLDDDLVGRLDRAAKEAGVSRSELIRRASRMLIEYLQERELDRRHEQGYRRVPEEPELIEAFTRLAADAWPG